MGLDITAYSNLYLKKPIVPVTDDDWDNFSEVYVYACVNPYFPHANKGLLSSGFYQRTDDTQVFGFRAGSYSSYGSFRSHLAMVFLGQETYSGDLWDTIDEYQGMPLWEMINLSDCEGAIGPECSQKLYDDMAAGRDKFEMYAFMVDHGSDSNYLMRQYDNFLHSYDLARQNGFVSFR